MKYTEKSKKKTNEKKQIEKKSPKLAKHVKKNREKC
jgi:hypothetical protein